MPSIHHSSFEAGPAVTVPDDEATDRDVLGFLDQTRNVLVGVRAVLERAVEEGYSIAVEGVHLVPGLVEAPRQGAVVCECLLAITDEEDHASHFHVRDAASEGLRPLEKYLDALPEIRLIQRHLVERAEKAGVPVIENASFEQSVAAVFGLVLDAAGCGALVNDADRSCNCATFAAVDRAGGAGERALARTGRRPGRAGGGHERRWPRPSTTLEISGTIVVGSEDPRRPARDGNDDRPRRPALELAVDPIEGASVVARGDYGAMSMIAVGDPRHVPAAAEHVHAADRRRARAARADRPREARGRERPCDRRRVRPQHERHHHDRARPAAPPRPDRGDPRLGRPDQADPGRGRDRVDHRGDPRHERPPLDRHRRLAAGGDVGRGAALSGRRAPGAAVADDPRRDPAGARSTGSRTSHRVFTTDDLATGERDRRGNRGVQRRPPARRPLPRRLRAHALDRDVHPPQLGAVSRRIHFFARDRREEVRLLG